MWCLYLDGDLVLLAEDRAVLVAYLEVYVPGTYRAEIDRIEDERLLSIYVPAQA